MYFYKDRLPARFPQVVPGSAILLDEISGNTMAEAASTLALMKPNGWRSASVVTDAPHVRRVAWAWNKAFEGDGLEFRVVATDSSSWHAGRWWTDEKSAQVVISEYFRLAYYIATN